MEHQFTSTIKEILYQNFGEHADKIFDNSLLIQYLNEKHVPLTVAQNREAALPTSTPYM